MVKLSQIHPVFYHARVGQLRLHRKLVDTWTGTRFARQRTMEPLPHRSVHHRSFLRRKLGNTPPEWQENKVVNLSVAAPRVDGLLIRPGDTFSFWHTIGNTTAGRGYLPGMELWEDRVMPGIGGGICQLANLLYWMALHTPLTVVERHHHTFDPFPDDRRVLPFGTGASVFYNYVDLRFHNGTDPTFQFQVSLTEEHLKGEIRSDRPLPYRYRIEERNHRFLEQNGKRYRENEVWRQVIDLATGETVSYEKLMQNFAEVRYELFDASPLP